MQVLHHHQLVTRIAIVVESYQQCQHLNLVDEVTVTYHHRWRGRGGTVPPTLAWSSVQQPLDDTLVQTLSVQRRNICETLFPC